MDLNLLSVRGHAGGHGASVLSAIVFLVIGVQVILSSLRDWRRERRLQAVGERTDGVVTRWSRHGRIWRSVFEFQTVDGRTVEAESRAGSSFARRRIGVRVRVLYDPADPEHARIDRAIYGTSGIVLSLGVGLMLAAWGGGWLLRDVL